MRRLQVDWRLALYVTAFGAVLPAILALAAGAGAIPRNDDWSYRGMALALFDQGVLKMDGASTTFAAGQILAVQPILAMLAGDLGSFWLFGLLVSIVVSVAAFALARQFLPSPQAAIVAAVLVVAPGYAAYSSSFMTDVPALAAQLACLAIGVRAIRTRPIDLGLVVAAGLVGVVGFSVRQFAVTAPLAVVGAAIWVAPRDWKVWQASLTTILALVLVGMGQAAIPGQLGALPFAPGGVGRTASLVPSLALILLPISLWSVFTHGRPRRFGILAGTLAPILVFIAIAYDGGASFTVGNLMGSTGVPTDGFAIGGRPRLWGDFGWLLLQLTALLAVAPFAIGVALTMNRIVFGWRSLTPHVLLMAMFTGLSAAALVGYSLLWPVFDRYLWPLIVPLGVVLLYGSQAAGTTASPPHRRARHWAIAAATAIAFVSAGYALNSNAFDAARWRAGERLVATGYDEGEVDAGYEWLGAHAPRPFVAAGGHDGDLRGLIWYQDFWPQLHLCAFVSGSPVDVSGFELVETIPAAYRLFGLFGREVPLYLYGSATSECRAGP